MTVRGRLKSYMAISIDKQFGIHQHALQLRSQRAGVLANNIANSDTPGYKARDIDFQSLLASKMGESSDHLNLKTTQSGHASNLLPNSCTCEHGNCKLRDHSHIDRDNIALAYPLGFEHIGEL